MKKKSLIIFFVFLSAIIYSQEKIIASGGVANGSGTLTYSVGQIFYSSNIGSNGSVNESIQQSIEIFTLSNFSFNKLTLKAVTYPNPTKDKVVLSLSEISPEKLNYILFNIKGKLIKKGKIQEKNTTIDISNYAAGVYVLKVYKTTNSLKDFKIIKH